MILTFDTNCLIQLEKAEPPAVHLQPLARMCEEGTIEIQLPAISASESPATGQASGIHALADRLRKVGLTRCRLLPTIGYWGVTFWDHTVWATKGSLKLEERIHKILFPAIECEYRDFCKAYSGPDPKGEIHKRWLNAKCDVAAMWCHIKHKGDIFVTSDKNFYKVTHKTALLALGAKAIRTPEDTLVAVRASLRTQGLSGNPQESGA